MVPYLKSAFGIFKKVILVVIVYFIVISLFFHFIGKDKVALSPKVNPIEQNRTEIYNVINDSKLKKTVEGRLKIVVYRQTFCKLMGEGCTNNPSDGDKNFNNSIIGFISNLFVSPIVNPPASGVYWAYSSLQNAGFIPKTLAAEGIGMGSIQPFSKIWKIFRDITYLLFVVILIAIGFMVMFRTKINPQTVISVENSLPRIIIALILITFSFAIAGFMIDLMYILIAIFISILGPIYRFGSGINPFCPPPHTIADLQKYYIQASPCVIYEGIGNQQLFRNLYWNLPLQLTTLIPALGVTLRIVVGGILSYFTLHLLDFFGTEIPKAIAGWIGSIQANIMPAGLGGSVDLNKILESFYSVNKVFMFVVLAVFMMTLGVNILLGLIIWFSIVFIFFRILFMLFSSYIKILLLIILSPLYLLFEAIPGQSAFTNWLKNLAGELITFPLIVGVFLLGSIISDTASAGNLIQFPFLVGIDAKSFGFIIGLALCFMAPDLVKAVRQVFIPKPGILEGAGPGVFFGGAMAGVSGGLGELSKVAGIGFYLAPVQKLLQSIPGGKSLFASHTGVDAAAASHATGRGG